MNALNPSDPTPEQKRVLDRILWRVMPFVTLCMVVGTIDRSNVGFAKISMAGDLGMSEAVFAFGASLFYVGYILFEIPSALGVHRFGARLWFARIDRKSVVEGKSVSVRVDLGGRRIIK